MERENNAESMRKWREKKEGKKKASKRKAHRMSQSSGSALSMWHLEK